MSQDYSKYFLSFLNRNSLNEKGLKITFDNVVKSDEYEGYDFDVSLETEEDETYLTNYVLDAIEERILEVLGFMNLVPGEVAYTINATLNGDEKFKYNNVHFSEKHQDEILESYNYYMRALRSFGVSSRLLRIVVSTSDNVVNITFVTQLGLPKGKTLEEIPLAAVQNALSEVIEEMLNVELADVNGHYPAFNIKIKPEV
jgi:hypothetical protein